MYGVADLRGHCPCATCNAERARAGAAIGTAVSLPEPVRIRKMTPVGGYAYAIHFSDGHSTGIYPLELLHSLGEEQR